MQIERNNTQQYIVVLWAREVLESQTQIFHL